MARLKVLAALLLIISGSEVYSNDWSLRTWQSNVNFNNSRNWDIGRVPCESDRVILQRSETLVLELPEGTTLMRELVLPTYTEILLPNHGDILITGKKDSPSCHGLDAVFKPTDVMLWTDPLNWDKWTTATPDLERIPCSTHGVRFPRGSTFRVTVPTPIKIGTLEINGKVMDEADWLEFADTEAGVRQFFKPDGNAADFHVLGDACQTPLGCECGNEYLRPFVCTVECLVPLCKEPIQPEGFCCPLCGAYLMLRVKEDKGAIFLDHLESFLKEKEVKWHASKVKEFIQVVLVENGEYSGAVSEIAEALKTHLAKKELGWVAEEFHASGHVWYPTSFGKTVAHFFSIFVFAALSLAALIVFNSQNWSWVTTHLSSSLENRPFVFARFENQSGEVVVANEERPNPPSSPQAFDNPMYGATGEEQRNVIHNDPSYTELEETSRSAEVTEETLLDSTNFTEYS